MDSSFEGLVLDPSKCSKLSMDEKRELIHELSKWSDAAPEMLQSWSRKELLEILCAETGKEKKGSGVTKSKLIEQLMKAVSKRKSTKRRDAVDLDSKASPANIPGSSKRQRKSDHPTRFPGIGNSSMECNNGNIVKYCQNSACQATLHQDDAFCKRCTCCICKRYDDNKDPSLWLLCSSEPPYEGDSCGRSCHLECAIKHKRAGISKDEHHKRLDGSFCCIYCGKINDLLGCWKKQLNIAKDTRRVDVLCYRVSLSLKLLHGTGKYTKQNEMVVKAAKMLEGDVGPLSDSSKKMGRGIVNRLSSGPDVQKLCSSATESLDLMLGSNSSIQHQPVPKSQDTRFASPGVIRFEEVSPTSIIVVLSSELQDGVGYSFWSRQANTTEYPAEPTCTLFKPGTRFLLSDLCPNTEYFLKVVPFIGQMELGFSEIKFQTSNALNNVTKSLIQERDRSPTTNSSSLSNPSSEGNESNNITTYGVRDDSIQEKGPKETPGDSVSALEEEHANGEVGSVHKSTNQSETTRNPRNPVNEKLALDILNPENLLPKGQLVKEMEPDKRTNSPRMEDMIMVPYDGGSNASPPITPLKPELGDRQGRNMKPESNGWKMHNFPNIPGKETQAGSSSKKANGARWEERTRDGSSEGYEHCVMMIRQLECEGYIEKNFRVKFLTWYSLRATPQERRVVKVFVDTFTDDPVGLAGQLMDAFSDAVSNKRPPSIFPTGFCTSLFH